MSEDRSRLEFPNWLLEQWTGESVIVHPDRPTGALILIAIYSTQFGSACGGTRMKSYPDRARALQDALRLAEGMAYKWAAADLGFGGAKAVIDVPPNLDTRERPDLLRRYGTLVRQLGGLFYTGPDVGTTSADMDMIAETGAPFVFCRTREAGGTGDSGPITAWGVYQGLRATCEKLDGNPSLDGRTVLVQGAGSVGSALIERLCNAGAHVLFSEQDGKLIRHFRDEIGLEFIPAERVYNAECDVFSPCALGGILNEQTIPQLRCRAVVGSANNQLASPEDAGRLRARGVLYAPDFVVNSGGVVGVPGMELLGWSRSEAEQKVADKIAGTLRKVFALSDQAGIDMGKAARRIAEERLAHGSVERLPLPRL